MSSAYVKTMARVLGPELAERRRRVRQITRSLPDLAGRYDADSCIGRYAASCASLREAVASCENHRLRFVNLVLAGIDRC